MFQNIIRFIIEFFNSFGKKTTTPSITPPSSNKELVEQDFIDAAKLLNVEIEAIKAVTAVESNGGGFFEDGRPKILFEAHLYGKLTNHIYDSSNPNISCIKWDKTLYKGGIKEYDRLKEAINLNREAALKATSFGLFQILGMNYKICGFESVDKFVEAQVKSEGKQLESFVKFVKNNKLDQYLKDKNWAEFTRHYNGPGQVELYSSKLQQAYNKAKNG